MAAGTMEPPSAPSAPSGVNIVDTGPPKPPPAPTTTIRVSQMSPPPAQATDPGPLGPPKKGMAKFQSELRKKAGVSAEDPNAPEPPVQPAAAPAKPGEPVKPDGQPGAPADPDATPAAAPPVVDPKDKKTNPWKLVDEWKGRASTLEKQLVELKKQAVPEQDRASYETRLQQSEARAKELEDEIRFVNYQKHPEFVKNYQQPYEAAWQRATVELSEISIVDPQTQQPRAATPQDLMELVNLPLGKAREVADQVFGAFADDVMGHRKEIKNLFENQKAALETARKEGGEREKQLREKTHLQASQLAGEIKQTWEKVNAQTLDDPQNGVYFKQREGDQEWNQRLGKGFQLVDQAYSENPADPKLSPEQRASVLKRHAAVRNRAAGWGALKYENGQLKVQLAERDKELAQYKGSTPPGGGSATTNTPGEPSSARERVFSAFRAKAK